MQSMNLMNFYCLYTKWKYNIFCFGKNSLVASATWLSFRWWFTQTSAFHKQQWDIRFPLSAELACLIPSSLENVFLGSLTPLPVWRKRQKCRCLPRNACDDALKLAPGKWLWKNCRKHPTTDVLCGLSLPSPRDIFLHQDFCLHGDLGH